MQYQFFIFKSSAVKDSHELKIIVCSISEADNHRLEQLLSTRQLKNVLVKSDPKHLKWMVATYKPTLIITGNYLWDAHDAFNLITELRQANNTPVVIWTNEVSEKIIAAVFNITYVHYIKKTEDATMLMDTITNSMMTSSS